MVAEELGFGFDEDELVLLGGSRFLDVEALGLLIVDRLMFSFNVVAVSKAFFRSASDSAASSKMKYVRRDSSGGIVKQAKYSLCVGFLFIETHVIPPVST
jgi:hypothetical protein